MYQIKGSKLLQRRDKKCRNATALELYQVWGLDLKESLFRPERAEAYVDHFINLIQADILLAQSLNAFEQPSNVTELVKFIKNRQDQSIDGIIASIQQESHQWARSRFDTEVSRQALNLGLKLWLFSSLPLSDTSRQIADVIRGFCEGIAHSCQNVRDPGITLLSADFAAKSLTRKGGFYIVWTSELSEHLTFPSKNQLRVFRHAHILKQYQRGAERHLFPDDFLEETYRTVHLLFPFEDLNALKSIRRITRKKQVDVESPMHIEDVMQEYKQYQISSYKYYGHRLAAIQRRYDDARPRRPRQWWYDRRQRQEWAALMVALIVFALTILFGVIQSITGIMQVWVSLKAFDLQKALS